jgi:hypothetical protein
MSALPQLVLCIFSPEPDVISTITIIREDEREVREEEMLNAELKKPPVFWLLASYTSFIIHHSALTLILPAPA